MDPTILLAYFIASFVRVIVISVIYTNVLNLFIHGFKLTKKSKTGRIISGKIPTEHYVPPKETITKEAYRTLEPYIRKLKMHVKEENLTNLYRNLKTLKLKNESFVEALSYNGLYFTKQNEIKIAKQSAIGHELLHAASSYYDRNTGISYTGFRQTKNNQSIGTGINEGYTELLATRIFNKNKQITAYHKEAKLARLLEFFFDDPKEMEKYYFNHDLPGLIHHLERYANRQEIINFIEEADTINSYTGSIYNVIPAYKSVKAQVTLYNWYAKSCTDKQKLQQFRNIVCQDKMAELLLSNKPMTINRRQPYQTNTRMAMAR